MTAVGTIMRFCAVFVFPKVNDHKQKDRQSENCCEITVDYVGESKQNIAGWGNDHSDLGITNGEKHGQS
jgi:hypothetical protein